MKMENVFALNENHTTKMSIKIRVEWSNNKRSKMFICGCDTKYHSVNFQYIFTFDMLSLQQNVLFLIQVSKQTNKKFNKRTQNKKWFKKNKIHKN